MDCIYIHTCKAYDNNDKGFKIFFNQKIRAFSSIFLSFFVPYLYL